MSIELNLLQCACVTVKMKQSYLTKRPTLSSFQLTLTWMVLLSAKFYAKTNKQKNTITSNPDPQGKGHNHPCFPKDTTESGQIKSPGSHPGSGRPSVLTATVKAAHSHPPLPTDSEALGRQGSESEVSPMSPFAGPSVWN